jgi:hypothetical protein
MAIHPYTSLYQKLFSYSCERYHYVAQKIIDFTDKTLPTPVANVCYQFMTTLPFITVVFLTPPKLVLGLIIISLLTKEIKYSCRVRDKTIAVISNYCFLKAAGNAFTVIHLRKRSILTQTALYMTIGSIGQLFLTKYK